MTGSVIAFVDDDADIRDASEQWLAIAGFRPVTFSSGESLLASLGQAMPDVVVTDVRMGGLSGLDLLGHLQKRAPEIPVVLITGHGDIEMAVQAMRDGAYDFIEKPFEPSRLVDAIKRASEKRRLAREVESLRKRLESQGNVASKIVGNSESVDRIRRAVQDLASADANVIIHGETGCGKELIAHCLHDLGKRRKKQFVAINCGAVPEHIFESELFGHAAGAFTGAQHKRIGKFEHADGGTLLLDEIESMPLNLQTKVLRVLQEKVVEPLGSNKMQPIDVRVIAATKEDLGEKSIRGEFREDLYYRLNVAELYIPPLRERGEDILLLFAHFAHLAGEQYDRETKPLSPEDTDALMKHSWPGNVRELKNVAERYVLNIEATGRSVAEILGRRASGKEVRTMEALRSLPEMMDQHERQLIKNALVQQGGSVKAAAAALGVPRRTLSHKMGKLGIDKKEA